MSDTCFAYTPNVLRWIRAHADILNEKDMAAELGCAPSSLRNICSNFRIDLCKASDPHADIAPVPGAERLESTRQIKRKIHPRLNPELRGNMLAGFLELRPQKNAITILDRMAAELHTSPAVLAAVIVEIVATENLFAAVLDLEQ